MKLEKVLFFKAKKVFQVIFSRNNKVDLICFERNLFLIEFILIIFTI